MNVQKENERIFIENDGFIEIAVGANRKATSWKNKTYKWSDLLNKLSKTKETDETQNEYLNMSKAKQDEIKDIGGFVGGKLKDGKRRAECVLHRQIITLDIDLAPTNISSVIDEMCDYAYCIYSTHKHSQEAPRIRLVIPLSSRVSSEEYEAIARKVASYIGIDYFDDTTYQPNRLMYWPSTSRNSIYEFKYKDAHWLSVEDVLGEYNNWRDRSTWPYSSRITESIHKQAKKQQDPLEKEDLVGAFCRAYDIHEVIEAFLRGTYEQCTTTDRYTYINGSTSAGVVVYDDKFVYSNHATDPASGKLCNAFDLVRLHKFGELDENAKENTPSHRLPSYSAMVEFVRRDPKVKVEVLKGTKDDFNNEYEDYDQTWLENLEIDKRGKVLSTINNIELILRNDPAIKDRFGFNQFGGYEELKGDLPWRERGTHTLWEDSDDSGLRSWLEREYAINSVSKITDAFSNVSKENGFHPVRLYLDSLEWDGVERLDTILVDYLGAEDNAYTRAVTRKIFTAAVARVYRPGTKFDTMLVITGRQGQGKSTLLRMMGKHWFNDSIKDLKSKDCYESLLGSWIIEMSELEAIKKSEVEQIKMFLSKQSDKFRLAYGRRSTEHKRQCVFFGTTNEDDFLKDRTGNRRFWPVKAVRGKNTKSPFHDLEGEVDQIWAEAKIRMRQGEKLYLEGELEEMAIKEQQDHMVEDTRVGTIEAFLDMKLPTQWSDMNLKARKDYIQITSNEFGEPEEFIIRDKICALEIWCELFGGDIGGRSSYEIRDINRILKDLDGWEPLPTPRKFGSIYGSQRGFQRTTK